MPASGAPVALDDLDRRRLAGAVRPEQREDLAGPTRNEIPSHDRPAAVALAEAVDLDRRRASGRATAAGRHPPPAIRRVLPLEVGVGQLADLDRAEDPVAVDEVALRPGDDAVRLP